MAMHTLSNVNPHPISVAAAEFQRLLGTRCVPDEPEPERIQNNSWGHDSKCTKNQTL